MSILSEDSLSLNGIVAPRSIKGVRLNASRVRSHSSFKSINFVLLLRKSAALSMN